MTDRTRDKQNAARRTLCLGHYTGLMAIAWTVTVGVSLAWNLREQRGATLESARIQARAAFEKDVLYRRWNAMHGGVYVPVTETTSPNPHLEVPERDIETPGGRVLTKVNPAYMTRQVHELGAEKTGVQGHITSLNPIRPKNAADPWETAALKAFENGAAEYDSVEVFCGEDHMRLMRPLVTEKGCLKCHAVQGYAEGDIRGGISASIPMAPFRATGQAATVSVVAWQGVFWLLGMGGIGFSQRHLRTRIRKQMQSEAELRESKARFDQLAEQSNTFAWEMDTCGLYTYVNHVVEQVLGYRPEELAGRMHFYDLRPEAGREAFKEAAFHIIERKEEFVDRESAIHTKDGCVKWVSVNGFPLLNADGTLRGYRGSTTDITERKRTEEAAAAHTIELEQQKTELEKSRRTAMSMMEDAQQARQAAEQSQEELHKSNAIMVESLEREKRAATELEAAMEQLEAATQEAQAASRSKSEFLANMSHEIRTPMTAILGFTENLLDPDLSDSEKLNAVYTVRRNGKHLLQLINDILDISKIEAGKLEVEHIRCSPVQLVADVQSLMQVRADTKNLPFNIEYIGAVPETIESDPTRLKQILVNLIGNAIKFTETGSVRLVTRFVETESLPQNCGTGGSPVVPSNCGTGVSPVSPPPGRRCHKESAALQTLSPVLQFDVIDTGLGMTEEQTCELFQAFNQADTSTTRKFGGTGLGLMISKRLAELLGGTITVESKPGEGSTFRVTVTTGPLDGVKMLDDPATATIAQPETAAASKPDTGKLDCRILLVEDGMDNQRLIGYVLKKAGAEVTVVENGKLAVDAALAALHRRHKDDAKPPFDVILMDMQMPVMGGYEATGLLRQKGYTGPIIALTAHAMEGDRRRCLDAGCDDYASKPIDRKKLVATIQEWLEKRPVSENEQASQTDTPKRADVLVSELAGDSNVAELVEKFIAELPDKLAAMAKTLAENDLDVLGSLAHQLKDAGGGNGFPAITEAAEGLEAGAKAHENLNRLRQQFDELADLCQRASAKPEAVKTS